MTTGPNSNNLPGAAAISAELARIVADSLPLLREAIIASSSLRREETQEPGSLRVEPGKEKTYLANLTLTALELRAFLTLGVRRGVAIDEVTERFGDGSDRSSRVVEAIAGLRLVGLVFRSMDGPNPSYALTAVGVQVYEQMLEDGIPPAFQNLIAQ